MRTLLKRIVPAFLLIAAAVLILHQRQTISILQHQAEAYHKNAEDLRSINEYWRERVSILQSSGQPSSIIVHTAVPVLSSDTFAIENALISQRHAIEDVADEVRSNARDAAIQAQAHHDDDFYIQNKIEQNTATRPRW